MKGTNFVSAKATLGESGDFRLFLEPGKDGFALSIILNRERGGTVSGRTFIASVSATPDSPPQSRAVKEIIVHYYQVSGGWHSTADPTPKDIGFMKEYRTGFAMYLEFGQVTDGQVTGRIDLRLPDVEGSSVAGVFTAKVQ